MSQVKVSGNASGTAVFEIAAPNSSTNRTLTLPDNTGTLLSTGSTFAGTGPAFSVYLPTTNQTVGSGTYTKVTLSAEEFDTAGAFNATGSTVGTAPAYSFNPQVAGYYFISAESWVNSPGTNPSYFVNVLYKNGTAYKKADTYGAANVNGGVTVSSLIYMNGSTDYVEFYAFAAGGVAGNYIFAGAEYTYMSGFLARAA